MLSQAEGILVKTACWDKAVLRYSPSVRILSALASLIPLIVNNVFFGVNATASMVLRPASWSFLVSDADIPAS
jgi:hypothetical protein